VPETIREANLLTQRFNHLTTLFNQSLKSIDEISHESLHAEFKQHSDGFLEKLCWHQANNLELWLIDVLDKDTLKSEWVHKRQHLHLLPAHLQTAYQDSKELTDENINQQRTRLKRLTADLQWQKEKLRTKKDLQAKARQNVLMIFIAAFIFFFTPTWADVLFGVEFLEGKLRIYYIFTATSAGLLGAAFAQVTSLKKKFDGADIEQLKAMCRISYTLTRVFIGAGAGLIMFYFLQSGLFTGVVFPVFINSVEMLNDVSKVQPLDTTLATAHAVERNLQVGGLAQPANGLSLLVIWCVLAGFSEQFVPDMLNKLEADNK
jgi:hypothetical protein